MQKQNKMRGMKTGVFRVLLAWSVPDTGVDLECVRLELWVLERAMRSPEWRWWLGPRARDTEWWSLNPRTPKQPRSD